MDSKLIKTILWISGLIGILIGGSLLLSPVVFYRMSGIELGKEIGLLNDLRSTGGSLLGCGILIILGALSAKLTFTSLVVSMTIYSSYGISRFFAIAVDGVPSSQFVVIGLVELLIGGLSLMALKKYSNFARANS